MDSREIQTFEGVPVTRTIVTASLVAVLGGALVGTLAALWQPWLALAALVLLAAAAVVLAVRLDRVLRHEERSARVVALRGRWHAVTARADDADVVPLTTDPVPADDSSPAAASARIDLHPAAAPLAEPSLAMRRGA
ncbi:hypothetical protein Slu03_02870 [Sediminihabitans luteus]|nr:hypothetical protein Slu03_02870 [Sediminihabitans luteus]